MRLIYDMLGQKTLFMKEKNRSMRNKYEIYQTKEYYNLKEVLENAFENYPENIAFKIKNHNAENITYREIKYKEFEKEINSLGTALIDMGMKNKRIAVIGKNRYEWILSYVAVVNGTGIVVPLDKGLPDEEIRSSLERSKTDCVIFAKDYIDCMKKIKEENTTQIEKFICMDELSEAEKKEGFIYLGDLLENGKKLLEAGNKEFVNAEIDNNKMSVILFTSGTTSKSKAVALSHRNIASNIEAMNKVEGIRSTDVNMAFLPLHHTFGCTGILLFLNHGCTNVFCDGIRHIQSNLKEYKVSVFVCVPLLIEAMYKKIEKEIEYRKLVVRKDAIEAVKEARAQGDLSENFEYKAAKQDKNRNDARIRYLQRMIRTAHVIEDRSSADTAGLYDTVEIFMENLGKSRRIQLVTTLRQDALKGLISKESPVGRAVMGAKVGDRVHVDMGGGKGYYVRIDGIEKGKDDGSIPIGSF